MNHDSEWSKKSPDEKADYLKHELEHFIRHQNQLNADFTGEIGDLIQDVRDLFVKLEKLSGSSDSDTPSK